MGFLEDFGISEDDVQTPEFNRKLAPVGHHNFEIGDSVVKKGTRNKPNDVSFIISFQLSDADGDPTGSIEEWFAMKQDGVVTEFCQQKLGFLDIRAKSLGFKGGVNDPEFNAEALIGLTGRLEVVHNTAKNDSTKVYANIRNLTVDEDDTEADDNEFEKPAAVAEKAAPRATGSRAKSKAEQAELFA